MTSGTTSGMSAPGSEPTEPTEPGTAAAAAATRLHAVRGFRKRLRVSDDAPAGSTPWPASTSTWCWHCCHPFDTPPLPLPIRYDDRRDEFHVMGNFCSWACMKTFNSESTSYMKTVISTIITLFHKRCTGVLCGIPAAPPRISLRAFGGHLSIAEFRGTRHVERCVLPPRMVVHDIVVMEQDRAAATRVLTQDAKAPPDLGAVVDFKAVSTKNETLRLKRPKPLKTNNRNLLEQVMGLGGAADA